MKTVTKFIKGALLIALFIGLFNFNASVNLENKTVSDSPAIADYFVTEAYADNSDIPELPPIPSSSNPPPVCAEGEAPVMTMDNWQCEKVKPAKDLIIPEDLLETINKAAALINKIFNPVINFITKHIGNLLGNDYIFGGAMGDMLHSIWVVSRNIVNIVFVLILLFLALKHIFSGDENADLKKVLPKFVIMLIAINFSWLASRVVLDAANVATNVAFAIPKGVMGVGAGAEAGAGAEDNTCEPTEGGKGTTGMCEPKRMWIPFDATENQHMMNTGCDKLDEAYNKAYGDPPDTTSASDAYLKKATYCWAQLDLGNFGRTNAAFHMTYSMARVQNLASANTKDSLAQIGFGILFSFLIQIVYLIAFGCLFIALILRVAALWFLVAFSPFLVLMHYLTKDMGMSEVDDKVSISAFMSWAFAPAKVAAVWAVGFIMVSTGQKATATLFTKLDAMGTVSSKVFSVSSLFMGMETLQQLIWMVMTIAIIWVGTFAVLTKLKFGTDIFTKVNGWGTDLAREVSQSPKWAPIIPMFETDEKGKASIKWGSYAQHGPKPLKWIRKMREHYEGPTDASKFDKAREHLSNATAPQISAVNNATDDRKRYEAFIKIAKNLDPEIVKRNQKEIERILKASGKFEGQDLQKLAISIKKGAEQAPTPPPATAAAPAAPPPPTAETVSAETIRTGVAAALLGHDIQKRKADIERDGAEVTPAMIQNEILEVGHAKGTTIGDGHVITALNSIAAKRAAAKQQPPAPTPK